MADFGNTTHPVARKQYRCEWCYGPIPCGEQHVQYKGVFDGSWQNWRMHEECLESAYEDCGAQGFEFVGGEGEMPERIKLLQHAAPDRRMDAENQNT